MKHLSKILIGFLLFFSMVAHSVLAATRDQKLTTQVTVYNCASTQLDAPTIVSKPPAGTGMMYAIPTGGTDVYVTCDANNFDAAAHSSIQVTLSHTAPLIIQYAYDTSDYCQFSLTAVNGKPEITAKSAGKVTCTVKNGAMFIDLAPPSSVKITANVDGSLLSQLTRGQSPSLGLYFGIKGKDDVSETRNDSMFSIGVKPVTKNLLVLQHLSKTINIPMLIIGGKNRGDIVAIFYCKDNFTLNYDNTNPVATIQFFGPITPYNTTNFSADNHLTKGYVTCICSGNACPTQH